MLKCFEEAHNVYGRNQSVMAAELGVTYNTLHRWFSGGSVVPIHRRQSIDRALDVPVQWGEYAGQFVEKQGAEAPPETPQTSPADTQVAAPVGWGVENPPPPPDPPPIVASDELDAIYGDL